MEKKPIEMDKKYRTRNGCEVRVLCTDVVNENYPVVALMRQGNGPEVAHCFTKYGQY